MFEVTISTTFSAAHSITVRGVPEPLHGHDWHVTAAVAGPALDPDGLLIDFHALERALAEVITPFRTATLNAVPPFDRMNPSAENVAAFLAHTLDNRLRSLLEGVEPAEPTNHPRPGVKWVRVTESPGCAATCFLSPSPR